MIHRVLAVQHTKFPSFLTYFSICYCERQSLLIAIMLTGMARRPPSHVQHFNGLHHQPYHSKVSTEEDEEDDGDEEEERDARRARSRLLANKLSESLAHRSSSSSSSSNQNKEDSIEQRLQTAIDICDIETLRELYSQPSCLISIDRQFKSGGWTALIHAAYACHFALVSLFVSEFHADINQTSTEKITPLMACCMSSHSKSSTMNDNEEQLQICRFLLEHGALIESDDEHVMTPLMFAARFGCSPSLIHLLVQYGAKIDRRDAKGWCPLIMATQHGHLGSVQALIQSGADLHSTTNNGLTALDIAQHSKHDVIVEYFLAVQKPPVSEIRLTMIDRKFDVFRLHCHYHYLCKMNSLNQVHQH